MNQFEERFEEPEKPKESDQPKQPEKPELDKLKERQALADVNLAILRTERTLALEKGEIIPIEEAKILNLKIAEIVAKEQELKDLAASVASQQESFNEQGAALGRERSEISSMRNQIEPLFVEAQTYHRILGTVKDYIMQINEVICSEQRDPSNIATRNTLRDMLTYIIRVMNLPVQEMPEEIKELAEHALSTELSYPRSER